MATPINRNVQIIVTMSNRMGGAASRVSNSLWQIVKAAKAAQFVFQGIAHTVGYFVQVNKEMEDLNLAFAGIIKAKGMADSFRDAMQLSRDFVQELRVQAGALPGSLNQYVDIARQAYQELGNIGFKTVQDQAKFIGQYGAVALTLQVPAAQAGRDLMHMLSGNVRANTRMFALLRHELGMPTQDATKAWRALTEQQRADRIVQALGKYRDMVKAAAGTWDAVKGAFDTHMQDVARMASAPYFDRLKAFLMSLNGVLDENKARVAALARTVVELTAALAVLKLVSDRMMRTQGQTLGQWLSRTRWSPFGPGRKWVPSYIRVIPNPRWTAANPGRSGTHLLIPTMVQVSLTFWERISRGMLYLARVYGKASLIGAAIWLVFSGVLAIVKNVGGLFDFMERQWAVIARYMAPVSETFGQIAQAFSPDGVIGLFVGSVLVTVLEALKSTFQLIATVAQYVASVVGRLTGNTSDKQVAGIMGVTGQQYQRMGFAEREFKLFRSLFRGVQASDDAFAVDAEAKRLAELKQKVPETRNGPPVYDFRGSKFTITQQFAEGFDPDRIAVAFADDLSSMADRRLQSSFSPVGAI